MSSSRLSYLLSTLALLACISCGSGGPEAQCTGNDCAEQPTQPSPCTMSFDCPVGMTCAGGLCQAPTSCATDTDCPTDHACVMGGCYRQGVAQDSGVEGDIGMDDAGADATPDSPDVEGDATPDPDEPNSGWIGGACEDEGDCDFEAARCLEDAAGFSAGQCTQACESICPDRDGNNSVTFCVTGDGGGQCVSRCDDALYPGVGCRDGYVCAAWPRHNDPETMAEVCIPDDPRHTFAFFTVANEEVYVIPDDDLDGALAPIDVEGCRVIVGVSVYVDIEHPFVGDLAATLTAPDQTRVILWEEMDHSGENLEFFIPEDFTPAQSLNAFSGVGGNGQWMLEVVDGLSDDVGSLKVWAITVSCRGD